MKKQTIEAARARTKKTAAVFTAAVSKQK